MIHLQLPRPRAAASLLLLSGLALVGLVPSAPANRSGSSGGLGGTDGTAGCPNVGTTHVNAQVIEPGAAICSDSTGVNFEIGKDAQGKPIEYSQPVCPSEILYRPSHTPKVAKLGHRVSHLGDEPYQRQRFFCNVNPSFSFCDTDGPPVAQPQVARSYQETGCDDPEVDTANGGQIR